MILSAMDFPNPGVPGMPGSVLFPFGPRLPGIGGLCVSGPGKRQL
jgi:hypothetical protein